MSFKNYCNFRHHFYPLIYYSTMISYNFLNTSIQAIYFSQSKHLFSSCITLVHSIFSQYSNYYTNHYFYNHLLPKLLQTHQQSTPSKASVITLFIFLYNQTTNPVFQRLIKDFALLFSFKAIHDICVQYST